MTSPGGREVGRVSVRVVPDTSRFREELRKQLQKLQDVEIDVTPVSDEFRERLREIIERAQKNNKVEIPVEFDEEQVERAGRGLREALNNANMPDFLNEMTRWDRMMRRVAANAERIRESLVRATRSAADMTRSVFNLRSHFEGISHVVRNLPGYIGLIRFRNVGREVEEGETRIRRFGNTARTVFRSLGTAAGFAGRVISTTVGFALRGIGTLLSGIGRFAPRMLGSVFTNLGRTFKDLGNGMSNLGRTGGAVAGLLLSAFGQILGVALAIVAVLEVLGAVSLVLAVVGAAITAAWGIVAGVIATIPSLLFALAGPIAAVALGFDGIKKAAQTLQPEIDKLRNLLNQTFENGFRRIFNDLRVVFPAITTGLHDVAHATMDVANGLKDVVLRANESKQLEAIFNNVSGAIRGMSPGINDIIQGFIDLGAQSAVFDLLTSAVNTFGAAFKESVQRTIADGTFQGAIQGLSGIIDELTLSFVALVENGLNVLQGAAPGIQSFLQDLRQFFGQFNWERLGTAVGNVFKGLGEALRNVDPATIKKIEDAFVRLGDVFTDASFQSGLQSFIDLIPTVIDWIADLADMFVSSAAFIEGAIGVISGSFNALKALFTGDWFGPALENAKKEVEAGWDKIGSAFDDGQVTVKDSLKTTGEVATQAGKDAFTQLPPTVRQELEKLSPEAKAALEQMNPAVEQGLVDVPTTIEQILTELGPVVEGSFKSLQSHVKVGIGQMAAGMAENKPMIEGAFTDLFSTSGQKITDQFTTINQTVSEQVTAMVDSVNNGLIALTGHLDAFSVGVGTNFQQLFRDTATTISTEMGNIVRSVTDNLTTLNTQFSVGQTGITNFGNAFTDLGTKATDLGVQLVLLNTNITTLTKSFQTVNTGLLTLNTTLDAANVSATTLNTTYTTLNQTLVTLGQSLVTVNTNVTNLITSLTTLNTNLVTLNTNLVNLSTSFSQLNLALPTLLDLLRQLNTAIVTLNTTLIAFTQNLTKLLDAVNLLIPAVRDLILALTDLNTAFVTLQETITTVMETIVTTVTEGLVTISTAWAEAVSLWVELVSAGMAAIVEAITQGMADAVTEVQAGVDEMLQILADAEQQFYDAGANMGQALADGLRSKAGEVRAAAQELADAAAAATRAAAQINSPSRVFIRIGQGLGEGLAMGIDDGRTRVTTSAKRLMGIATSLGEEVRSAFSPAVSSSWADGLVEGATTAVDALSGVSPGGEWAAEVSADDFGGITQAVSEALAGWNVVLDSNGMAKLVNKSNTRRVRRR